MAATTTCSDVTPDGGVPVKLRSTGENFIQSGRGLPSVDVADTSTGVLATLWVKVLSGSVNVKLVPADTFTGLKASTATKPALPEAPESRLAKALPDATGTTVPVASSDKTSGALPVPEPDAVDSGAIINKVPGDDP